MYKDCLEMNERQMKQQQIESAGRYTQSPGLYESNICSSVELTRILPLYRRTYPSDEKRESWFFPCVNNGVALERRLPARNSGVRLSDSRANGQAHARAFDAIEFSTRSRSSVTRTKRVKWKQRRTKDMRGP